MALEAQVSKVAAEQVLQSETKGSAQAALENLQQGDGLVLDRDALTQYQNAFDSPMNANAKDSFGEVRYGFSADGTTQQLGNIKPIEGNAALDAMQSVKDKFEGIKNEIEAISNKKDFTQVDLMHLQMSIIQLSYIADLSAKTADKMSQAAQTLFRNQ